MTVPIPAIISDSYDSDYNYFLYYCYDDNKYQYYSYSAEDEWLRV